MAGNESCGGGSIKSVKALFQVVLTLLKPLGAMGKSNKQALDLLAEGVERAARAPKMLHAWGAPELRMMLACCADDICNRSAVPADLCALGIMLIAEAQELVSWPGERLMIENAPQGDNDKA